MGGLMVARAGILYSEWKPQFKIEWMISSIPGGSFLGKSRGTTVPVRLKNIAIKFEILAEGLE